MSDVFQPHSPGPDPRQAAIAELQIVADEFRRSAATSVHQAISITYARCADRIEDRIEALHRGVQLAH